MKRTLVKFRGLLMRSSVYLEAVALGALLLTALLQLWKRQDVDHFFIWLSVSIALVGISTANMKHISQLARRESQTISARFAKHIRRFPRHEITPAQAILSPIDRRIKSFLEPRVETLNGLDAVCREAAKAVEEAHGEEDEEHRFITFYGSASLSTVHAGANRFGDKRARAQHDEDIQTPEQIYAGALEAASTDRIRVRRYIRLYEPSELMLRGRAFREEYLAWLKSQHLQLKRNPNYRITSVVRAPRWGNNLARIVTHRRLLELVGNGEGGLLLVGTDVSASIRRHSRASILENRNVRNKPVHYSQAKPPNNVPGEWKDIKQFEAEIVDPAAKAIEAAVQEKAD